MLFIPPDQPHAAAVFGTDTFLFRNTLRSVYTENTLYQVRLYRILNYHNFQLLSIEKIKNI